MSGLTETTDASAEFMRTWKAKIAAANARLAAIDRADDLAHNENFDKRMADDKS